MMIGPIVTAWDDWGSVYNDLEVWREIIHKILSLEGISYNTIENGYPGTSAVFIIDRNYVIKIYPGLFVTDHRREWPVLTLLENFYDQPPLLATGFFVDSPMNWPYAILRYIDGTAYREISGRLSEHEKNKFIRQLADKVNKIHSLPFETLQYNPEYHWSISENEVHTQIEKLCQLPFFNHADFRVDLYGFITREKPLLQQQECVLVHGDLTRDHLFFKKENGEWLFTDIIDWGDAQIAPRFYDFVVLWAEAFANQNKEWQTLIRQCGKGYLVTDSHFQNLFTVMLFLHPFACDLIVNVYNARETGDQKNHFQSVASFIQWIFIE